MQFWTLFSDRPTVSPLLRVSEIRILSAGKKKKKQIKKDYGLHVWGLLIWINACYMLVCDKVQPWEGSVRNPEWLCFSRLAKAAVVVCMYFYQSDMLIKYSPLEF